jgi:hypothetical protein
MPEDVRYLTALAAAQGIIHSLSGPGPPRPRLLAKLTYRILDAIREAEELWADGPPSAPSSEDVALWRAETCIG